MDMLDYPARQKPKSTLAVTVPAPGIAPMLHAFNPFTSYLVFWRNSAFHVGGEVAQSWLHFVGARWLRELEFPQQIARCKTAADVNVAIAEFWQQAAKDYSSEFHEIADLTWAAMRVPLDSIDGCSAQKDEGCCGKCSSTKPA
jgi:hypothetical protein